MVLTGNNFTSSCLHMVMATTPIGTHLAPTMVDTPFRIHNHTYGGPPY
jgi:hypothetical protein